jgi:gag-polypeptide of LTR copia-type
MDTSTQTGKIAFALVRGSKKKDYPDGTAAASWRRLKAKYMPDTAPTITRLHQAFYSSKLQQGYDPDIWMTKLEFIRLQLEKLDYTITDEQFMVHIINNLTKDYETLVDILGRRLGKTTQDC